MALASGDHSAQGSSQAETIRGVRFSCEEA